MLIRPEDVAELNDWPAERFAGWLSTGLIDYVARERSSTAFAPLHRLIIPTEPILDQLAQIYDFLSTSAKARFAEGIGIAVSELPNTISGVRAFQEFTHLCGFIGTAHALNKSIDRIDDPAFLAAGTPDDTKETYALLLNVAAGLTPSSTAKSALMRLITSPRFVPEFEPEFAPMAFDALVRAEPTRVGDHLSILEPILCLAEISDQVLDNLVSSTLAQVDGEALKMQFPQLSEQFPRFAIKVLSKLQIEPVNEENDKPIRVSRKTPKAPWIELPDSLFGSFAFARMIRVWTGLWDFQNLWSLPRRRRTVGTEMAVEIPAEVNDLMEAIAARRENEAGVVA